MKNFRLFIYIIAFALFSPPLIGALLSINVERNRSALWSDSLLFPADSLTAKKDSSSPNIILPDSTQIDTILVEVDTIKKKEALDAPVDYVANDSTVFVSGNLGFLYGDSKVDYRDISLKGENLSINIDSSTVHATYGIDSIGEEFGYPVFGSDGTEYEAKSIRYNFKTKKGYSIHTITQQGEGYVVAERTKKTADDAFFMCDGRYTTCDHHDHPHFYLMLTKAKVRPKKNIIAGPAYLVIEDLPIPFIGLPFGFFPFTDKYSSGVIMPSYVDEMDRGFGLRDGGYYLAINDHIDLALTGEIYTKGSWGLNARSTYRKRYKYSGNFNFGYRNTKYGDKGDPDYSVMKDLNITWSHSQDPKSNIFRTLSASVNFATSTYSRNDLTNQYDYGGSFTNNTRNSSVTLTQRFPNSPFTLSANMSAAQITRDSTVALTMPNLTVSMNRIFPFKRKEAIGAEKWYEKIQISYTGDLRNSITTKEDKLLKSNLQKDWQNAMKHTVPISATFNVFNYLNITPSFQYTERWYTKKVNQEWNGVSHVAGDTTYGFNRVYDFNYALSFQTKLYGFYEPLFKIGKMKKIRHVFTPSISFSGQPDFSDSHWGFYESYDYFDANGRKQTYVYSPYSSEIFGTAPRGAQGNINFSFDNNVEMQVATDNDSTKIISLIDNLGIRFSYNMQADSLKWSDISTNMRLKLSKNLTVNVNATFDPYMYGENGQVINQLRLSKKGYFGRLKSTGYSISPSINQDTFKKWFGKGGDNKSTSKETADLEGEESEETESTEKKSLFEKQKSTGEYDDDGYLKNDVKWTLSANYSFNYAYDYSDFDKRTREYARKLTHNLGFSGSIQPTKNWNFNFNTSYDFDANKFAYVSCSLTRNLHCWSISANFRPIGPYKSYFVTISASSSMLQDLKYDKRGRSSSFDPEWY